MPFQNKKSFFDKITNLVNPGERDELNETHTRHGKELGVRDEEDWTTDEEADGQLTVDVFQTPVEIVVQAIVAGVKPEDLSINLTRDMVTIKGKRSQINTVTKDNYFFQELYWGSFSRSVLLPEEVDIEHADASEKNGLLTIRLPKIDKDKTQKLKVKSG